MELVCHENAQFWASGECSERRPVRAGCDPVLTTDTRVWRNLMSLEKKHTISESYFGTIQKDVKPYMRRILTVWMLQVRFIIIKYQASLQTCHLEFDSLSRLLGER